MPRILEGAAERAAALSELDQKRFDFWESFIQYCEEHNRGEDIVQGKPSKDNWYDVEIGSPDYRVSFRIFDETGLEIALYVLRPEVYERL